jgi:hypothetical protein
MENFKYTPTNRNEYLRIYDKSIDIEISPENEIFSNFKINDIPNVVNISYCDVTDIINLFNTIEGGILIQKVFSNEITLNIFPVDTTYINEEEKEYLIGHESLLKRDNVNFYQIWYDPDIKFKYHLGSTIHEALFAFINKYSNYSYDYFKKTKHFLTLNNYWTPYREDLFNLYDSLSSEDKQKFTCSFKFKDIHLKNEIDDISEVLKNFDACFGDNLFPHYDSCLIEIVSESSKESVTEKSFKPLLSGIPFIHWMDSEGDSVTNHQIKIFNDLGIDTCYFGIDYTNKHNISQKIQELLSMGIDEIREKYKEDFEKAELNKIKVFEWIHKITNDIIK